MWSRGLVASAALVACAAPAPRAELGAVAAQGSAAVSLADAGRPAAAPSCPAAVDLRELLERHSQAFGTLEEVAAALPRRIRGSVEQGGSRSAIAAVLDRDRFRTETSIAGIPIASGIDARGAWSSSVNGVVHRLEGEEAIAVRFASWLENRGYLRSLDDARDDVRCDAKGGTAHVTVSTKHGALGDPELVFDLESARLEAATVTRADGSRMTTEIVSWTPAARRPRFPAEWVERPEGGSSARVVVDAHEEGVSCDDACTTAPDDVFSVVWPKRGSVTIPMVFQLGQVSVRAEVEGRSVWALLDSGAGVTAVDTTTPLGAAFHPLTHVSGRGSTQKITAGLGELRQVTFGALTMPRLPVVSVPIPALDAFGARRPELILGYSLFAAHPVRIDYARKEIVVAESAERLHGPRSPSLPIRYWGGRIVVELEVEGARGFAEIDTGNSGGVGLNARWATAHGLPGVTPKLEMSYRGGAGTEETKTTLWRAKRTSLGPIRVERRLVHVDDPHAGPNLVGIVGNEVFARCAAIVVDAPGRRLWFEPPCDRPVAEDLSGWRLDHRPDPAWPDRPWIVSGVLPGGTADRAGVLVGDRLLSVDGKPATLDRTTFGAVLAQAPGTVVKLEVEREGARTSAPLRLVRILEN